MTLLYHGVPRKDDACALDAGSFARQVTFLKRNFDPISPTNLYDVRRARLGRIRALLTFDGGFRNNAEVVALILRKHRMPAVFFVSSHHATPGKYLRFACLLNLAKHFKSTGFVLRERFMNMSQ